MDDLGDNGLITVWKISVQSPWVTESSQIIDRIVQGFDNTKKYVGDLFRNAHQMQSGQTWSTLQRSNNLSPFFTD